MCDDKNWMAQDALWQASREGLWLERSEGKSTYRCVTVDSGNRRKPFKSKVRGVTLGMFATAEEAALCSARRLSTLSRRCESTREATTTLFMPQRHLDDGLTCRGRRRVVCAFMGLAITAVLLQVVVVVVLLTHPEQPAQLVEIGEKSVTPFPTDAAVANSSGDKVGLTLLTTGTPIIGYWLALSMRPSYVPY